MEWKSDISKIWWQYLGILVHQIGRASSLAALALVGGDGVSEFDLKGLRAADIVTRDNKQISAEQFTATIAPRIN